MVTSAKWHRNILKCSRNCTIAVLLLLLSLNDSLALVTLLATDTQRTIRMHLNSLKEEYYVNESVQLTYWIENYGSETQFYRDEEIEELSVFDANGREFPDCYLCLRKSNIVHFNSGDSSLTYNDWREIAPGSEVGKFPSDLLFGQTFVKPFRCGSLPAGRYQIMGKGFPSDTLQITIVDPKGTDEEEAAIEFARIMELGGRARALTRQGHLSALIGFVDRYPSSVYAPRALGELLSGEERFIGPDSLSIAEVIVTKFPEYSYAAEAIWKLENSLLLADLQNKLLSMRSGNLLTWSQNKQLFIEGLRKIDSTFNSVQSIRAKVNELRMSVRNH